MNRQHLAIILAYDYFAIMLFQIRQECDMKLSTIWQQLLHLQGQCQVFYNWVNFKINKTSFLPEGDILSDLSKPSQLDSSLNLISGNLNKEQVRLNQVLQDKENIIISQRQEIQR